MLRDGEWMARGESEHDHSGEFRDDVAGATRGRLHLYVSYACPWASRVLMVRALKGLEEALPISVLHPYMGDDGWAFRPGDDARCDGDPVLGADFLREIYLVADPYYTGAATVPALWDRELRTIVNNSSEDLIKILEVDFDELATTNIRLYPEPHRRIIDETIEAIYEPINKGVYQCGLAATQRAYDRAFTQLFDALDQYEDVLSLQRYLCGDAFTLADVCLFTTLVRFDPVYYVLFKCNGRLIAQYRHLSNYMRDIYQLPGVARTVDMRHIKQHYYTSQPQLNPRRIVAAGPQQLDLGAPHDRARFSRM